MFGNIEQNRSLSRSRRKWKNNIKNESVQDDMQWQTPSPNILSHVHVNELWRDCSNCKNLDIYNYLYCSSNNKLEIPNYRFRMVKNLRVLLKNPNCMTRQNTVRI